jgi:hypothetical protein
MLDVNYQTSLLPQSASAAEQGWRGGCCPSASCCPAAGLQGLLSISKHGDGRRRAA